MLLSSPKFKSVGVHNPGATSILTDGIPIEGLMGQKYLWYIQAWDGNCERLHVDDFFSTTLVLSSPLKLSHPNGSVIICTTNKHVGPWIYGAQQSVTPSRIFADDWVAGQRCIYENRGVKWQMGGQELYHGLGLSRPLFLLDETYIETGFFVARSDIWDARCTQTGIPNDYRDGYSSTVKTAGACIHFTANADNTIVLDDDVQLNLNFPVVFGNIYPSVDTLPVGTGPSPFVPGKHYLIKTWNPATKILTISEITTPGITFDITVGGSGYMFCRFTDEIKYGTEDVHFNGSGPGWDAFQATGKEGSYTKDVRSWGRIMIGGTATVHSNLECQNNFNSPAEYEAVYIFGKAHEADYINSNGGDVAVRVGPSEGILIQQHYCEGMNGWGLDILAGCHGLLVKQPQNNRAVNIGYLRDLSGGRDTSYEVGPVRVAVPNFPLFRITGVPDFCSSTGNQYDYRDSDLRFTPTGIIKTPDGVKVKHKFFQILTSSDDLFTTWKLGRITEGAMFIRGSGQCILPDCTGLLPGEGEYYIYKQHGPPPYTGGTIYIRDHLGNTLDTLTSSGILKFYRWFPQGTTYDPSWWKISNS